MGERQPKVAKAVRRKYNLLSRLYDHIWPAYIRKTIGAAVEPLTLKGNETLLDIGCGTGELEKVLIKKTPQINIVGIDLSEDMLRLAKQKLASFPNIILKQGDFSNVEFQENSFDAAFSISNLHYFSNPHTTFNKIARLLKTDGKFILVDWNRDSFNGRLYNWYMGLADPAFAKVYTIDEASKILQENGFRILSTQPFRVGLRWQMMRIVSIKA